MAEKAGLLWPRLPRKLGRGQAWQALPGRIFPVSLAKNPESLAWPGFARLAGFLTALLMQGMRAAQVHRQSQTGYCFLAQWILRINVQVRRKKMFLCAIFPKIVT